MGLLLVLVGPDSVAVLADNEFSAINMGVDDSEPDNEFSAINMGVDDSGGSDIFGFVPAWLDGIIRERVAAADKDLIADGLKGELSPVEEVGVDAVLGTPPDAGLWRSSSRAGDGGA
uniref:Uncharacterized protein OJ1341F06.9 n=1 Tax=Oryza sativa subsp. japonica TaxID=39947 RepID=Q8S5D0_ORYSJ|nr:Hypothetical protein [Oryza sativa Japonica Group]